MGSYQEIIRTPSVWWTVSALIPWFILGIYLPIFSLIKLKRLAIPATAFMVFTAWVSLSTFDSPNAVWQPDIPDGMYKLHGIWNTAQLWSESEATAGWGWDALLWFAYNYFSQTFYGERVVGLWMYMAFLPVLAFALKEIYGTKIALLSCALASAYPPFMWISRYWMGMEQLIIQTMIIYLIWKIYKDDTALHVPLLALLMALSMTTYSATRILITYPGLLIFKRPKKCIAVYCLAAIFWSPVIPITHAGGAKLFWRAPYHAAYSPGHERSLLSLFDEGYGQISAASWPGAQTMSRLRQGAWVVAANTNPLMFATSLISLAPDVAGSGHGSSHRQMFFHVPAIIATASVITSPYLAIPFAVGILADNYFNWTDDVKTWIGRIRLYPLMGCKDPSVEWGRKPIPWCWSRK